MRNNPVADWNNDRAAGCVTGAAAADGLANRLDDCLGGGTVGAAGDGVANTPPDAGRRCCGSRGGGA